ncbi:putative Predicted protein [Desulfamplus magnetovallimortis]|uniref:Uncharacterized protein n=1 Tax=Desulfamplus magnetovallimortis TaxID=1246637 RepID=A0A1W1HDA1_9BACT|nr:DUF6155 family protein [Desulfamplus magnetovallimortis]SLM30416.1 putative Predicted protein [Desulfamplus magnetovallimortis]
MKKFTLPALKKELAKKTKEELIKEISSLCQEFPQVKEYYKAQYGDTSDILKRYIDIIEKEFVEGKRRGMPKARLSVAKNAVKDFRKLITDIELVADVMFTFVECISNFNDEFGVDEEDYYTDPEDMFEEVLQLLKKNGLSDKFQERAYDIVNRATDSWGHLDSLQERYEDVYGDFIR